MDRNQANALVDDIRAALEPVMAKHGLQLKPARATYSDSEFKMTVKVIDPDAEIADWMLESYGLPAGTKPGVEFTMNGKRWRFDGVAPNRPKYPIDATEVLTGKPFKLTRDAANYIAKEVNA